MNIIELIIAHRHDGVRNGYVALEALRDLLPEEMRDKDCLIDDALLRLGYKRYRGKFVLKWGRCVGRTALYVRPKTRARRTQTIIDLYDAAQRG